MDFISHIKLPEYIYNSMFISNCAMVQVYQRLNGLYLSLSLRLTSLQGWKTTPTFVLQLNLAKQSCPQYKVLVRLTKQTRIFVWVLP